MPFQSNFEIIKSKYLGLPFCKNHKNNVVTGIINEPHKL